MFGAIVGDIAGSTYERYNLKFEGCPIFAPSSDFTDDTVLTLATADHYLFGASFEDSYRNFGRNYPDAGYGASFRDWMFSSDPKPYNSWGNGSAMRVSPVGWVAESLDGALTEAVASAEVTHNHPEGIKGAQAVAAAVFLARAGKDKDSIKGYIEEAFGYDLQRSVDEIRPTYAFDVSCQGSVPEALIAFFESVDFESALRKAISLGGDSDTIACISGAVAHAYYKKIPTWMVDYCFGCLDPAQRSIIEDFWTKFPVS
ncbi:MAG: ADP-ribosylglycohydrolase family protein [Verrucomicrobiota bacterium]